MSEAPRFKKQTLEQFLKNPNQSLFREAMFRHQLLHEIYTTCATLRRGVHLYEPEIDVSGFDLVLDDLSETLRFQLKSKMASSRVREWKIHKLLLRPNTRELNSLPFLPGSEGVGYMGGVILITADVVDDRITYSYSYTDALIICAMQSNIGAPRSPASKRLVEKAFLELVRPDSRPGQMKVPETAFWKFSTLKRLLQFVGFGSDTAHAYRYNLSRAISSIYGRQGTDNVFHDRESAIGYAQKMIAEMFQDEM